MYFFEGPVTGERSGKSDTTMNMVLRPGEAIVWRWGQLRPLKHHGMLHATPTYEDVIYNGLWEYRPDFSKAGWRKGAAAVENITMGPEGLAADEGQDRHDRLDDAQSVRLRGRPARGGGRRGQVLHLPGRKDLADLRQRTWTSSSRPSVPPATSTSSSASWKARRGFDVWRSSMTCRWLPWPCRR